MYVIGDYKGIRETRANEPLWLNVKIQFIKGSVINAYNRTNSKSSVTDVSFVRNTFMSESNEEYKKSN